VSLSVVTIVDRCFVGGLVFRGCLFASEGLFDLRFLHAHSLSSSLSLLPRFVASHLVHANIRKTKVCMLQVGGMCPVRSQRCESDSIARSELLLMSRPAVAAVEGY
jgi:hypothetical protein